MTVSTLSKIRMKVCRGYSDWRDYAVCKMLFVNSLEQYKKWHIRFEPRRSETKSERLNKGFKVLTLCHNGQSTSRIQAKTGN